MQQRVLVITSLRCRWTEAALNRCLASLWAERHRWLSWSVAQMSLHMNLCEMKTFWAFNLTPLTHMLFCIYFLLILWTLSKCYCVKCSRISQISVSYISQGSAATHLTHDGQCDMGFVANLLENTTVKEFWKRVNICQSYKRMYNGTVFWLVLYITCLCVLFTRSSAIAERPRCSLFKLWQKYEREKRASGLFF